MVYLLLLNKKKETVAGALAFTDIKVASIAVNSIPRSGKP